MDQSGSVQYLLALNLFLYQRLVPSEKSLLLPMAGYCSQQKCLSSAVL